MKGLVENVSIARNGQVVVRVNGLDYWTNEAYLHALLSSKGIPADVFMLAGCELEFTKISHKAGDAILDGNGKALGNGQTYRKDGQRMEKPSLLTLGGDAQEYRSQRIKAQAKLSVKGAFATVFKKSERSAPADNIIVDVQKDGTESTKQTKATQAQTVAEQEDVA